MTYRRLSIASYLWTRYECGADFSLLLVPPRRRVTVARRSVILNATGELLSGGIVPGTGYLGYAN